MASRDRQDDYSGVLEQSALGFTQHGVLPISRSTGDMSPSRDKNLLWKELHSKSGAGNPNIVRNSLITPDNFSFEKPCHK